MGLEPTKMRHDLKKSVSVLPEGEEKILSFISDFTSKNIDEITLIPIPNLKFQSWMESMGESNVGHASQPASRP